MNIQPIQEVTDELVQAFERLIPQLTTRRQPPDRAALTTLVNSDYALLLVARYPNETSPIVGSATLILYRTPTGLHAHLEDVIADESLRGKGIGIALTEDVIRRARESGADYLSLTSNPARVAANQLYQKLGFKDWETNIYRIDFR